MKVQDKIAECVSDINGLRDTIIYCKNRILRKQMIIEELLLGLDVSECKTVSTMVSQKPNPPEVITVDSDSPKKIPVTDMIEAAIPALNGNTFWYRDIKRVVLEKFPDAEGRLKVGLYNSVNRLVDRGVLVRDIGGYRHA